MPAQNPLATAQQKGVSNLSERQTKAALNSALTKLGNLQKKATVYKENAAETGTRVVEHATTAGTTFLASMSRGYLGRDKLQLGGVDVRALAYGGGLAFGLFRSINGKGGGMAIAAAEGVGMSWLADIGVDAGQALQAKYTAGGAPVPTGVPLAALPAGVEVVQAVGANLGNVREVLPAGHQAGGGNDFAAFNQTHFAGDEAFFAEAAAK